MTQALTPSSVELLLTIAPRHRLEIIHEILAGSREKFEADSITGRVLRALALPWQNRFGSHFPLWLLRRGAMSAPDPKLLLLIGPLMLAEDQPGMASALDDFIQQLHRLFWACQLCWCEGQSRFPSLWDLAFPPVRDNVPHSNSHDL